jgi:5-methyltetrahydrofolate--homocysteine methyltransferase
VDLAKVLAEKEILIFDGAMGTELVRRGLKPGGSINLDHAEDIIELHRAYLETGVDIITTNTFTLNRISCQSHGLTGNLVEVNLAGVRLGREAAAGKAYVFGDIGPTGKLLEPYGSFSEEQFYDNFKEQARILAEGGSDGLIIETMTDLREALCALKASKDATDLPVIVTLSFATTEKGGRTIMGSSVAEVAKLLEENGADAVGANCGDLAPAEMAEIAALYREKTTLPILIQPNAGKPRLIQGETIYDMPPEKYAEGIMQCLDSGASLIGGCCGTTLDHIRAVVQKIR